MLNYRGFEISLLAYSRLSRENSAVITPTMLIGDDLNQRIVIIALVHELYDTWKELLIVTVSCIYENVTLTPVGRTNVTLFRQRN